MTDTIECDCRTWGTDRLDLDFWGNGHHHNCPKFVAGQPRKVWEFEDGGTHWFVATTRDEAMQHYRKSLEDAGCEFDECVRVACLGDYHPLTISNDGGEPKVTKTCMEWAMEKQPGMLCTTEY